MDNKLLLQYLSAAGADTGAGNSIGQNVNAITQQNISSQNHKKLLQAMLRKGVDAKIDKNNKLTMSEELEPDQQSDAEGSGTASSQGGSSASASPSGQSQQQRAGSFLDDLDDSDLAGLSPEMISDALKFKFGQDQFEQSRITGAKDMEYKDALIGQAKATTAAATPSVGLTINGTDIKLTNKQYIDWYKSANKDERTAAIKNFEYAQKKGYEGSFEEFQRESSTTHQKDFDRAKKDGYDGSFNEWMLEMAKAGAITIGEISARTEAKADISAIKYFTNPKGLSSDVDKYMKSEEVQNKLFEAGFDPGVKDLTTSEIKVKFIEDKIVSTGGSIEDVKYINGVMSWTVKWPNGKTETVSYGIGS